VADVISQMLLKVKADTGDAKRAVKSLRGTEKAAARARLSEMEKQNKSMDETIAMWGKVAGAVGAAVGAYAALDASVNSYLTNMRAEASAAGADLDRLRKSTAGLVEDTDILLSSGKLMNGTWKFTQDELDRVFKGMTAVRKLSGVEMPEALKRFTEALSQGTTEELKRFGIQAKDKQGVLRELDELFNKLGGNVTVAGDEFIKTNVDFKNAMDEIKTAIGSIVVAMAPLITQVANLSRQVAILVGHLRDVPSLGISKGLAFATGSLGRTGPSTSAMEQAWKNSPKLFEALIKEDKQLLAEALSGHSANMSAQGFDALLGLATNKRVVGSVRGVLGGLGSGDKSKGGRGNPVVVAIDYGASIGAPTGREAISSVSGPLGGGAIESFSDTSVMNESLFKQQTEAMKQAEAVLQLSRQKTVISALFGTPEEISLHVEAIGVASKAFAGFTTAVGSGIEAMITGSESFAVAFKRAIADSLVSISVQSAIESLKFAAVGFGHLVYGNAASASLAFKSSLLHGGVALAAGAAARGMGAGGSAPSASRGSGGSVGAPRLVSGGGGGSSDNQNNVTINMGGDFLGMTAQERAAAMSRAIKTARKGSQTIRRQ